MTQHYREVCQFGHTHNQCRCVSLSPRPVRVIVCPDPNFYTAAEAPEKAADGQTVPVVGDRPRWCICDPAWDRYPRLFDPRCRHEDMEQAQKDADLVALLLAVARARDKSMALFRLAGSSADDSERYWAARKVYTAAEDALDTAVRERLNEEDKP